VNKRTAGPRRGKGPHNADQGLAARVCWSHFRDGRTQQEIADHLGLSRATINKIIKEATRSGLVQVSINSDIGPCMELEAALRDALGLREVVVVPAPYDPQDVRRVVGLAAGEYVSTHLRDRQILGLTWGGTVAAAAQALRPRNNAGNVVVSLSGGLHKSTAINPYDNAASFARALDAQCYYMTAPMIVDSSRTRDALLGSKPIAVVLDIARRIDLALLTAVDLSAETRMVDYGVLTPELVSSLVDAGAVGNVCDVYLDARGAVVDHPVNRHTVSVPLDIVRALPHRVLAAGGAEKAPIIFAIVAAGLCDTLITEEVAARQLLADVP